MKVKDFMTNKVTTVCKNDSITNVALLMQEKDFGFFPVLTEDKKLAGALTDRDIVIRGLARGKADLIVDDVMTHHVVGIDQERSIDDALQMMGEHQMKRLIVIDSNKDLVGVVTITDFIRNKELNKSINETLFKIYFDNPQREKPLKYLKVDDFRL